MSIPTDGLQKPPPYAPVASPSDRHESDSSNPVYHAHQRSKLAPWQRRWNVEWLNKAMIPDRKCKFLRLERPGYIKKGFTRADVDAGEEEVSDIIAEMIRAGFVSKENAHKRTWLRCVIRRYTWRLQLIAHDIKAVKKCWDEFKNKDKLWRVTAVMEEQGENPRWQAEMTFTIQPKKYEEMEKAGQWIEFPSPEDIKWFYVTDPKGVKRLHATDHRHWGPNPSFEPATTPFGERNGRVVRHPLSVALPRNFRLFVEQVEHQRCDHCGCMV
ncbi:hypothetical protein NUW58_g2402 [Xylaria curta]|uniref:Uncharacterized protein n=1 Tax=Xylaria curta TaxID=42375 RepID=A0ACC1PHP8_9PEZI|nr:hypothetical protein NUW58_g2402 [Xylaria curta]